MKLSIIVTLLCLATAVNVSAAEIRWNGELYRTQTVTPITVDAYGRILPSQPITVLIPVREEKRSSVKSTPRLETDVALAHVSRDGVRFANLGRPSSRATTISKRQNSGDNTMPRTFSSPQRNSQLAGVQAAEQRPVLRDSRLGARRVY